MATTSLSFQYRPVKIGFLVRQGSLEDLMIACGLNSLLEGGLYNPIIPVSSNSNILAHNLIDVFSVEILHPVEISEGIKKLLDKYSYLTSPDYFTRSILREDPETKHNSIAYLDALDIILYLWDKEFKNVDEKVVSDITLLKWEPDDPLRFIFSINFGYYPSRLNLQYDYERAFLQALRGNTINITHKEQIHQSIRSKINPIKLTANRLRRTRSSIYDSGLYIGDSSSFNDLVNFWNLRAAGISIEFLPKDFENTFRFFIGSYLNKLEDNLEATAQHGNAMVIYSHSLSDLIVRTIIKDFAPDKTFVFSHCNDFIWNGLNIKPAQLHFDHHNVLAHIDKTTDGYKMMFNLPEKPWAKQKSRVSEKSYLSAFITQHSEYDYENFTLNPPLIRDLNTFYSTSMILDPHALRISENGISILTDLTDQTLTLYPLNNQQLIDKILVHSGFNSNISQPGNIMSRILEKVHGIDGARIFKIKGVRELLQNYPATESVSRSHATKVIWNDGQFCKYEELFIEPRKKPKLTTDVVFDFLVTKEFFRAGLKFTCGYCRLKNWLSLNDISDWWICEYCGFKNQTSMHLKHKDQGSWLYRKSGLFAKNNKQEGAIPVILALWRLYHQSGMIQSFIYSPSLNIKFDKKSLEIDFLTIQQHSHDDKVAISVAECKSEQQKINREDIDNLISIKNKFAEKSIMCYPIFAKTADSFEQEEMSLFKNIADKNILFILFTNKELESYDLHEAYDITKLPYRHPITLKEMALNSRYIYLQ